MLLKNIVGKRQFTPPKNKIDFSFISKLEGGMKLEGYVPVDKDGKGKVESGVTIGTGVDLGNADIYYLNIPTALKITLKPYIGKKGDEARKILKEKPLKLKDYQVKELDNLVFSDMISDVISIFNKASATKFNDMEPAKQTVIASLAYQYGARLDLRTPRFWKFITTGQWDKALKELRNFKDNYSTRRNQEADLLETVLTTTETKDA